MITADDVRNVTFSRAARGYKINEVDDFLEQVIDSIEQMKKDQADLLQKIEVLADRIQEYRNDEDSIRSALLTAQKSADKILKDANEEKERLLADARQQADDAVRLSQEKSINIATETREKVSQVLSEAKEKSSKIMADAKAQSEQMLETSIAGCKQEKEYLDYLKEQEISFRQQLVEMYKKQFELLKKGPELIKDLDYKLSQKQEPVTLQQNESVKEHAQVEDKPEPEITVQPETIDYVEPEDIPLPIASSVKTDENEDIPEQAEGIAEQGFEIKRKFNDIKFGDEYDIANDEDYEDYGV